ncbi:MAG: FKBP-type peptidyl-prolyl cis-trans isomerase [Actinomycetota bacterium]
MRRLSSLVIVSALALAACGGSDADSAAEDPIEDDTGEPDAETGDAGNDDPDSSGNTGSGSDDDSDPSEDDAGTADDSDSGADGADTNASDEPDGAGSADKPEVDVPGEAPAELVRTVLIEGTGEPASEGDTVVVDYVGVRSLDGVEFDNSYDRGEPFPVTLGSGGVIAGWERGLDGARSGERVQLDIPADLAYGEAARSDVIRENEPLTFVIDVRQVVKIPDASDAPTEPGVELSSGDGVDDTEFVDLVEGSGPTLAEGDTAVLHFVYYRADNGVALESSWEAQPLTIAFVEAQLLPGLAEGMQGMQVGGRRAITIPPEDGFGDEGNPQGGLPADTDIIFVVDLLGAF